MCWCVAKPTTVFQSIEKVPCLNYVTRRIQKSDLGHLALSDLFCMSCMYKNKMFVFGWVLYRPMRNTRHKTCDTVHTVDFNVCGQTDAMKSFAGVMHPIKGTLYNTPKGSCTIHKTIKDTRTVLKCLLLAVSHCDVVESPDV